MRTLLIIVEDNSQSTQHPKDLTRRKVCHRQRRFAKRFGKGGQLPVKVNMAVDTGDSWSFGDAYEVYMGRWSRTLASTFVDWLAPPPSSHWLEVGCGTGALTMAICERARPASVVACDPSQAFIQHAQRALGGACTFQIITPGAPLPTRPGSFDVIVSGLVLNFLPDPEQSLAAMRERCRAGGTVSAYVWSYVDGIEFLRHFWDEVVALDAKAAALDEGRRFAAFQQPGMVSLFEAAGLLRVESTLLEIPTVFTNFDDYWRPFLGGTGPAPAYVAGLGEAQQERLRARLEQRLATRADGQIHLRARAFAVRGVAP
jgi:SAM-dependent methyltransferase